MRKITYTNVVNGLSVEFSTENPLMHLNLEGFDGSSVSANSITYTPVEYDGQKTVLNNLSARTITLPLEFSAKVDGKYSRSEALKIWEKLCSVFVPVHSGTLVWTDGTRSRQIECRAAEVPRITRVLPFMFSTVVNLVADFPYWEDMNENSKTFTTAGAGLTVTNECALAVPLYIDAAVSSGSMFGCVNVTAGKALGFSSGNGISGSFTIDTKQCVVILSDGNYGNHYLTANSDYFWLLPGDNVFNIVNYSSNITFRWKNMYLGVE